MRKGQKFWLILTLGIIFNLTVGTMSEWPTALLWSVPFPTLLAAVFGWSAGDRHRMGGIVAIAIVGALIMLVNLACGVTQGAVYWPLLVQTICYAVLIGTVRVARNRMST